ncbi:hypothetical protein [Phytopseudomonas punonensis]|uniref:hypothetical protein n=1 Tax=Phytopseudomonas punonensis TaxID=1220495 RepID=UPI001428CE07|nr:hypothetical protein [Pseudomonas punonensis]
MCLCDADFSRRIRLQLHWFWTFPLPANTPLAAIAGLGAWDIMGYCPTMLLY